MFDNILGAAYPPPMRLGPDGAQHFPAALSAHQTELLDQLFSRLPQDRPGTRLSPVEPLAQTIAPATTIAASFLGASARPVRATLFDKTAGRNWSLGWHQDRTIAVRERVDVAGFTNWTIKSGLHHAVPPFDLLERMLTLRIHLDPVGPDNAPLLIVPGSHRLGRIAEPRIPTLVARLGSAPCHAERGDIWVYSTPILHASARAETPTRRRVLQLLYSADDLPGALEWLGV